MLPKRNFKSRNRKEKLLNKSTISPVISPPEDPSVLVEPVCDGRAVDLHAGSEDDELVPPGDDLQEVVDVRPLVDKEPDRVPVDGHLQDEVWRRSRLDGLPEDAVVMGVDQGLVQVKHQNFATN